MVRGAADTRGKLAGAVAASLITVLFCLLLVARDPLVFWNDDYEISILPVCEDMARAWQHGEVPLLSPYSWVCGNLAGEFQYGVLSVFLNVLIVVVWKLPFIFAQQAAALSVAHLAVLSAGAFLLARDRNLTVPVSMLVSVIASLNGWIICWGASDWLGALGAFAWLPWAWWASERALDPRRSHWRFLWPALFVYLLITGGFPYTVLMLGLVLAWLMVRALLGYGSQQVGGKAPAVWDVLNGATLLVRWRSVWSLAFGIVLGLGLSAPTWLALLDYVQGSARTTQNPSAHYQWLVPWNAWAGLIVPAWTVRWSDFSSRMMPHSATELACGLVPIPALIAGFFTNARRLLKSIGWELGLLGLLAVFAMLPTAGVFRWSFRWLPLFHVVLALCAAHALGSLLHRTRRTDARRNREFSRFAARVLRNSPLLAVLCVLAILVSARVAGAEGDYLFPLVWIFLLLSFVWLGIDSLPDRLAGLRNVGPAIVAFLALLATYTCIPPNCGVPKYDFAQSLLKPDPLDQRRLYLSIYPAPETVYRIEAKSGSVGQTVRPGSASMWAGLRFINGYSPIRPAGVAREFAAAIHGEIDPSVAEWLLTNEAHSDGLLARIGVDGLIVARQFDFSPRPSQDWQLVETNDEGRVFHRRGEPIASVRSVNWDGSHRIAQVSDIIESRNYSTAQVAVPAEGAPALLAFSRPFFRGYRARVAGRELPVTTIRNLIPLVEIPAGTQGRVTLVYRPDWLVYGGSIALVCAAVCIGSAAAAVVPTLRAR